MLIKNKGVENFVLYRYRYGISMTVLVIATIILLTLQLGDLVEGISDPEAAQGLSNDTFGEIIRNPLYAPYKIVQWLSITLLGHSILALRIPSILFGAASVALLYDVFRHWHRQRIAILGSMFFVTSSWFLHYARFGTAAIVLVFFILALLWAATRLHHAPVRRWPFLLMALAVACALYVPYMLYFLIAGVALHRFAVKKYLWHLNKKERMAGIAIFFVIIAPLVYAFITDPGLIKVYFGIPSILPTITEYFSQIPNTLAYIFWRSEPAAVLHLSTLPMLDIFTATMAALGIYQYEKQLNQHRTKWLFIGSLVLILTLSFAAQQQTFVALAPLVYIFAATGVVTLLLQWYEIFPKNPVARATGLIPIILLLLVVTSYHSNRYFIAWARAPQTKEVFNADTTSLRLAILDSDDQNIAVVSPRDQHITLEYSLTDVADSVAIMTQAEFNRSDIQADVTYVYRDLKISKTKQTEMQFEDYINTYRQINPISYKKYIGPSTQLDQ